MTIPLYSDCVFTFTHIIPSTECKQHVLHTHFIWLTILKIQLLIANVCELHSIVLITHQDIIKLSRHTITRLSLHNHHGLNSTKMQDNGDGTRDSDWLHIIIMPPYSDTKLLYPSTCYWYIVLQGKHEMFQNASFHLNG